ncbi:hypothetical protein [Paenibacillus bouchesdurhonensis]|uniref:hypothetical protein n=1 Tax=Paenibacillus bouchesdurhonensis TaxID=1870990 RepID=UPI000DA63859|nr:hypothetical protein [Paenibacillus bouchesdurhonensis]
MTFLGLEKADREKLQYEVISDNARLQLTRLIRRISTSDNSDIEILRQNRFINIARNVLNLPLYVLEADYLGQYNEVEYAWHIGEIELIMRRPDTIQLIETLADYIENNLIDADLVMKILCDDGCSFLIEKIGYEGHAHVQISSIEDIEESPFSNEHPNIRLLINRMERSLFDKDYSAVLHSSASIFETLAKDIVNLQTIQNKSLGNFFERYRHDSKLPNPILDYIHEIFRRRNTEPLAGHGNLQTPTINQEEAIVLTEMTKTFVRIERKLAIPQLKLDGHVNHADQSN